MTVSGGIFTTLGGGSMVGIRDSEDYPKVPHRLVIERDGVEIDIGPATVRHVGHVQEFLERLKIHCQGD